MALGGNGLEHSPGGVPEGVILTSDLEKNPDRLPVKEIYINKTTGKIIIVYDDGEE